MSFEVEGFAVDENGVSKEPDLHLQATKIGNTINNKVVTTVSIQVDIEVGWGKYLNMAQPKLYDIFYPTSEKAPPKGSIIWLGKTNTYKVSSTLSFIGEWTWNDESTGLIAFGTDGERKDKK